MSNTLNPLAVVVLEDNAMSDSSGHDDRYDIWEFLGLVADMKNRVGHVVGQARTESVGRPTSLTFVRVVHQPWGILQGVKQFD